MNSLLKATVLVVDDEGSYREMIATVLHEAGYQALTADSGKAALEIVSRRLVDAAILDLMMPGIDGRELMKRLKQKIPDLPVVFLTAYGSIPSAVEAIKEGAADYLTKPLPHVDDLILTLERVLEHHKLKRQSDLHLKARKVIDPFPCASPAMKRLLDTAAKVADTDVTVLITGESGTGKERMAQFIHLNSSRASSEMVAVNCAAIVENLLESELFGHEKGAFTGADARKSGRFEEADNSTLFLDEIGEMPIILQPKLLRVLQEKEFRRVGGNQTIRCNARLIAATNRDLKKRCGEGDFREDLYYRVSGFSIHIPPLRDRPEDIIFFSETFVAEAAQKFGKPPPSISEGFKQALLKYDWPGNVRELANVIEASVLLCDDPKLQLEDLHGIRGDLQNQSGFAEAPLADAEKKALVAALAKFSGNREQTAEFLGMSRRNLIYKLKKHGLTKK